MSGPEVDVSFAVAGHLADRAGVIDLALVVDARLDVPGLHLVAEGVRAALPVRIELDLDGLVLRAEALDVVAPAALAAELDLAGFGGGGRLEKHGDTEWRGAVTAHLGPVAVTGLGVLRTEQKPFSMVALLTVEFFPPIQLSFGFTLAGVGGLVGINSRPDPDALAVALSSGELSRLLFPRGPLTEVGPLLDALDRCFPPTPGAVVVGPLVKLGWGTPTIVAATVGVLVSDRGVLVLGRVAITLPFEVAPLIRLEAMVKGSSDARGLALDATLANSSIVGLPVEGDLRLRMRPGPDPLFAISAGGFHPGFEPPDGMGGMRRIGTEISPGPVLRARLAAYLAVTTESVQFGAHAELAAEVPGFSIRGHLDVDAFILLQPFGFSARFSAGVSVECADFDVASVELRGDLSGPAPWRIRGSARVRFFIFSVPVDLPEISWGPETAPALPPARDPLGVLLAELGRRENWTASSSDVPPLAQPRPGADPTHTLVHPLAGLGFRQSAVPLGQAITRMDGLPLLSPVTLGVQRAGLRPVAVAFPPGQFFELDEHEKLRSAGYAKWQGGFDVDPPGVRQDDGTTRDDTAYETTVLSHEATERRGKGQPAAPGRAAAWQAALAAAARPAFVGLTDPGTAVLVTRDTLAPIGDVADERSVVEALRLRAGLDAATLRNSQVARLWEVRG